jgi:NCAIR mutase (PurE)-related protein
MDERELRKVLTRVRKGQLGIGEALEQIRDEPVAELGYATVDMHRHLRTGVPEVVLGEGKSIKELLSIGAALIRRGQSLLVTRLSPEKGEALGQRFPLGEYAPTARIFHFEQGRKPRAGVVAVITAGTSDIPVAEEAAITAEALGATVRRIYDVGVAGLHRVVMHRQTIGRAHAAVVVAGMEGALASVVGGLVGVPIVAVPTSVGYGANLRGISALLSMLNSCAPNVATVNIDNGFGGGFYGALISRLAKR